MYLTLRITFSEIHEDVYRDKTKMVGLPVVKLYDTYILFDTSVTDRQTVKIVLV